MNDPKDVKKMSAGKASNNNTTDEELIDLKRPKELYFNQLVYIAKIGLEGDYVQIELAHKALEELREEILITEGGRIKNKYIMRLGVCALIMGVVAVVLGFLFRAISLGQIGFLRFLITNNIHPYFFVFAGSMAGAWISCGVRKEKLVFKDLAVMEEDMLRNVPRLFFVGITSVLFLLFLKVTAIDISIGTIKITDIMNDIEIQVFVGALAGLLGNKLSRALSNKANEIVSTKET